jgi:hypothetical protein
MRVNCLDLYKNKNKIEIIILMNNDFTTIKMIEYVWIVLIFLLLFPVIHNMLICIQFLILDISS